MSISCLHVSTYSHRDKEAPSIQYPFNISIPRNLYCSLRLVNPYAYRKKKKNAHQNQPNKQNYQADQLEYMLMYILVLHLVLLPKLFGLYHLSLHLFEPTTLSELLATAGIFTIYSFVFPRMSSI